MLKNAYLSELTDQLSRGVQQMSPGQRATRRVYEAPVSHVLRVDVDIKNRRVRTRHLSTETGEAYYDHEAKAKRATRVHLISGHVDLVEPQEFVMAAFHNAAGNIARLHTIGGHGQVTVTDVPLSAVVRVEKLR